MARTRTLAQLRADVLWQADREGTSLRNDPTQLNRVLNQSIAEFREAVSDGGNPYFLKQTTGSLNVGPTSPYHFATVDLSALNPEHLRVYGFDIQVSSRWLSLEPAAFRERNDVQQTSSSGTARPLQFFQFERSAVAYSPASDQAYPYLIWYLPVHQDLAVDGDTFDGMNGWEDWVVFNAVARLLLRDRDEHLERFEAERQRLLTRIVHVAKQRQRAGALVRGGNFGFDRRGLGRDRPFGFLPGAGDNGLNEPGTGEVGRVAVARSDGKINWKAGQDEGASLKYAPDSTGFSWQQRRGFIEPDVDYSGAVDATAEIRACIARARKGACLALKDGLIKVGSTTGSADIFDLTGAPGITICGSPKSNSRGPRIFSGLGQDGTYWNVYGTGKLFNMGIGSAVLNGSLYYPNQWNGSAGPVAPTAYDYTFYFGPNQHGATVQNFAAINPYNFLNMAGANGALIEDVWGYPLNIGMNIGLVSEVTRCNNVHFNPSIDYQTTQPLWDWVQAHGTAWIVDGVQMLQLAQCHAYGYNIGFDFRDADGDVGTFGRRVYGEAHGSDIENCNICIRVAEPNALGFFSFSDTYLVPRDGSSGTYGVGVRFDDTHTPTAGIAGYPERPTLEFTNLHSWSGATGSDRVLWMQSGSYGKCKVIGGDFHRFNNQGALQASANGLIYLNGVSMGLFFGSARTANTSGNVNALQDLNAPNL